MRDALRVGDEVITIGGIIGKVEKINEKSIIISTSAGKNKIEFLKSAIASVSSKDPNAAAKPAAKDAAKDAEEEKAPSRDKKVTPKYLSIICRIFKKAQNTTLNNYSIYCTRLSFIFQ